MQAWAQLCNAFSGKRAVVIGKGPRLDDWLRSPALQSDDVLIGINQAASVIECRFAVTTDLMEDIDFPHRWHTRVYGVPSWKDDKQVFNATDDGDRVLWFIHLPDTFGKRMALRQSRELIARNRWLYTASSSAQPAVHLAWYLGCTDLLTVGIGDGGQYAQAVTGLGVEASSAEIYLRLFEDTSFAAQSLFGSRWKRY